MDISQLPSLKFAGFYSEPKSGQGLRTMGCCFPRQLIHPYEEETISIKLNCLYLLNKLGQDYYFENNPKVSDDYTYINISFNQMIETCSHELVHYIQLAKHGKSSCKGDLKLKNGKYDAKLTKEHEEFTREIYGMIKNSGKYSEWERRWKEI